LYHYYPQPEKLLPDSPCLSFCATIEHSSFYRKANCSRRLSNGGAEHFRLLLGKVAFQRAQEKLDSLSHEFDLWKETTLSADFPEGQ
jgi:hypothetical protein